MKPLILLSLVSVGALLVGQPAAALAAPTTPVTTAEYHPSDSGVVDSVTPVRWYRPYSGYYGSYYRPSYAYRPWAAAPYRGYGASPYYGYRTYNYPSYYGGGYGYGYGYPYGRSNAWGYRRAYRVPGYYYGYRW